MFLFQITSIIFPLIWDFLIGLSIVQRYLPYVFNQNSLFLIYNIANLNVDGVWILYLYVTIAISHQVWPLLIFGVCNIWISYLLLHDKRPC